jgi:hypothetical protein
MRGGRREAGARRRRGAGAGGARREPAAASARARGGGGEKAEPEAGGGDVAARALRAWLFVRAIRVNGAFLLPSVLERVLSRL